MEAGLHQSKKLFAFDVNHGHQTLICSQEISFRTTAMYCNLLLIAFEKI